MRKISLVVVALLVVASGFSAYAAPQAETTGGAKVVRMAYLTVVLDHPFWRAQSATVEKMAREAGVDLSVLNAGNDPSKQASQVDSVILQKPDVVIFTAVDTGAGASLVAKMKQAGIPVVSNNRPIPGANYDIQIVIDPVLMGKQSAEAFAKFAKQRYGTAKGTYFELQGQLSDDNVIQWELGFKSVMDKNPQMKWDVKNTNWDLVKATQQAADAFMANPNYDGIWTQSDYLIPAITPVVKDRPKSGQPGHSFWVSHSGDDYALEEIRAGRMDVTINMPVNDMAALSFEYAMKLVKGEKIMPGKVVREGAPWSPSEIRQGEKGLDFYLSSWVVDKSNVDDPNLWGNLFKYK